MNDTTLAQLLARNAPDFYRQQMPDYVAAGLNPRFSIRLYQEEAIGRMVHHFRDPKRTTKSMQLLYHMATGSGKTLVMAGLMLYLYEQGYRNFLFFVNSTTIIEKTRDNFLNAASAKYLFAQTIWLQERAVKINEVGNFGAANEEDLNIAFATIQGLHTQLNNPSENSLTYDDFEQQKIVLISDEAHHINAATKKGHTHEEAETLSWESTVGRIFQANSENILLEFTATANLALPEIARKYKDLIIYDYPLKTFRLDGYAKEVHVLQADMPLFDRALQAAILSQYRLKLFEAQGQVIKPVLLFKSKTIKESLAFRAEFEARLKALNAAIISALKVQAKGTILDAAFQYFAGLGLSNDRLVLELQASFSAQHLLTVNSKEESEQQQIAVNSLEEESNPYRIIFAVDKLNEGWDVLNLFDIVRLYDTRDAKAGRPGKTTVSEAQLIGRGARYCPFFTSDEQPVAARKFDDDPSNELRICETLYYHSAYNPQYIRELNTALVDIGIKASDAEEKPRKKKSEKAEAVADAHSLTSFPASILEHPFRVQLHTKKNLDQNAFELDNPAIDGAQEDRIYRLADWDMHLVRKALNKLPAYRFDRLKRRYSSLPSVREFIASPHFLGGITLKAKTGNEPLSADEKLSGVIQVLKHIAQQLKL